MSSNRIQKDTIQSISYPDSEIIQDALQRYFDHYHFNNGGYFDKWFKIKFFGPFVLTLPNIKARVDAVKLHDIHNLLTEYVADLRGESEIGAWEIAAGCGKYYVGWVLNSGTLVYGTVIWPGRIYKAFMAGRHCSCLYHDTAYQYNQELLSKKVGELRNEFGINSKAKNTIFDRLLFISTITAIWILFLSLPFLFVYLIFFR